MRNNKGAQYKNYQRHIYIEDDGETIRTAGLNPKFYIDRGGLMLHFELQKRRLRQPSWGKCLNKLHNRYEYKTICFQANKER